MMSLQSWESLVYPLGTFRITTIHQTDFHRNNFILCFPPFAGGVPGLLSPRLNLLYHAVICGGITHIQDSSLSKVSILKGPLLLSTTWVSFSWPFSRELNTCDWGNSNAKSNHNMILYKTQEHNEEDVQLVVQTNAQLGKSFMIFTRENKELTPHLCPFWAFSWRV